MWTTEAETKALGKLRGHSADLHRRNVRRQPRLVTRMTTEGKLVEQERIPG